MHNMGCLATNTTWQVLPRIKNIKKLEFCAARYASKLLVPAEGFSLWPMLFVLSTKHNTQRALSTVCSVHWALYTVCTEPRIHWTVHCALCRTSLIPWPEYLNVNWRAIQFSRARSRDRDLALTSLFEHATLNTYSCVSKTGYTYKALDFGGF